MNPDNFESLELRIQTILPEEYQDSYQDVQPVSMGSASLKYGPDGKVAWDDIWKTFCDLAMAGGPPHKGKLLEPATQQEIDAAPERYAEVVAEICRGVNLVTGLEIELSPAPGWVRVECANSASAGWLVRAAVMENVSARCHGTLLDLPAGPAFRVEKEIKNVVTVMAKTCHYWFDHMGSTPRRVIADLFAKTTTKWPLVQPAVPGHDYRADRDQQLRARLSAEILRETGLRTAEKGYPGWIGLECPDVRSAIWMMRATVVSNVLARREETTLYLPVNPLTDPQGELVVQALGTAHRYAKARGVF